MNIPATKEEILENFKQNSNGRPLNKDDYEIAEALSRITYKAYEVGMEDAKQLYMEDMMDNKRCNALHVFKNKTFGQLRTIEENGKILFCASDVAKALGYTNAPDAVKRHCRYTVKHSTPHPQAKDKMIEVTFIPEGDVYRLITTASCPAQRSLRVGFSMTFFRLSERMAITALPCRRISPTHRTIQFCKC